MVFWQTRIARPSAPCARSGLSSFPPIRAGLQAGCPSSVRAGVGRLIHERATFTGCNNPSQRAAGNQKGPALGEWPNGKAYGHDSTKAMRTDTLPSPVPNSGLSATSRGVAVCSRTQSSLANEPGWCGVRFPASPFASERHGGGVAALGVPLGMVGAGWLPIDRPRQYGVNGCRVGIRPAVP
jgi:hypothetical protein